MAIITLLTDFGTHDYFVAALKAVLLSRSPSAQLVDLSHDIPPQDIAAAAFNLLAVYRDFPAGTVHLAVVDPGVGSARKALALRAADQFFVGPDNGLFSYVLEREPRAAVVSLDDNTLFRLPVSRSFHGRDIFAPVAAALATGTALATLGATLPAPVRLPPLSAQVDERGVVHGRVLHIDRFGNGVTNLDDIAASDAALAHGFTLVVAGQQLSKLCACYADASASEAFVMRGSAGFLEVAVRNGSAAQALGLEVGIPLQLHWHQR